MPALCQTTSEELKEPHLHLESETEFGKIGIARLKLVKKKVPLWLAGLIVAAVVGVCGLIYSRQPIEPTGGGPRVPPGMKFDYHEKKLKALAAEAHKDRPADIHPKVGNKKPETATEKTTSEGKELMRLSIEKRPTRVGR